MPTTENHRRPALSPGWKLCLEIGPLVAFFVAFSRLGIFAATGLFMAAATAAVVASYFLERRLPVVPLFSLVLVLVFGSLTLLLKDEVFIKLKVTLINGLFAAALLVGLALGRPLIKPLLGSAVELEDQGWRKLTLRWAIFFAIVAGLNELVWRNFSTAFWVNFKVFGILPLTLVFALCQAPLLKRYARREPDRRSQ